MKYEKEYLEHIKEAEDLTKKAIREEEVAVELSRVIFEKAVSPYHYFVQEMEKDKPTPKQIDYATQLNIDKPEQYTRKELSKKIDEVRTE